MRRTSLVFALALSFLLAACASPTAAPDVEVTPEGDAAPATTITIQDVALPTAVPSVPQGELLTVGFNVRGWT